MSPFKADLMEEKEGHVVSGFASLMAAQLGPEEELIPLARSSINSKGVLTALEAGEVMYRFLCCGEIELAGNTVHAGFKPAAWEFVAGHGVGDLPVKHRSHALYSARVRRGAFGDAVSGRQRAWVHRRCSELGFVHRSEQERGRSVEAVWPAI